MRCMAFSAAYLSPVSMAIGPPEATIAAVAALPLILTSGISSSSTCRSTSIITTMSSSTAHSSWLGINKKLPGDELQGLGQQQLVVVVVQRVMGLVCHLATQAQLLSQDVGSSPHAGVL